MTKTLVSSGFAPPLALRRVLLLAGTLGSAPICAGCSVVNATASVASLGVNAATTTVKAGASVAGAAGHAVFRKSDGTCYSVDGEGKQTRVRCS